MELITGANLPLQLGHVSNFKIRYIDTPTNVTLGSVSSSNQTHWILFSPKLILQIELNPSNMNSDSAWCPHTQTQWKEKQIYWATFGARSRKIKYTFLTTTRLNVLDARYYRLQYRSWRMMRDLWGLWTMLGLPNQDTG